jgi:hypothetical protein
MSRYTQITILCEDRQQEVFARYFLVACGINSRRLRVKIAPQGRGSGAQYVYNRYPVEVQDYRRRCKSLNIALAVLVDADVQSVRDCKQRLDEGLEKASLAVRQPGERIGLFVPKRNIETWIHYLQGEAVNEQDTYRKLEKESDCKAFVVELAKSRFEPLPERAPNSLRAACDELPRILDAPRR